MIQTFEAFIDENGAVQLLEPVQLSSPRRALVTILDARAEPRREAALATDWNRAEDAAAWSYLQIETSK